MPSLEIRTLVARTLDLLGPVHAARVLGVSRSTLLTVAAGGGVLPGSLALLREAYRRSELAREADAVARSLDPEVARCPARPPSS